MKSLLFISITWSERLRQVYETYQIVVNLCYKSILIWQSLKQIMIGEKEYILSGQFIRSQCEINALLCYVFLCLQSASYALVTSINHVLFLQFIQFVDAFGNNQSKAGDLRLTEAEQYYACLTDYLVKQVLLTYFVSNTEMDVFWV